MGLSRRDLMKNAGMLAAATGFGSLPLSPAGSAIARVAEKQAAPPELPWLYKKSIRLPLYEKSSLGGWARMILLRRLFHSGQAGYSENFL